MQQLNRKVLNVYVSVPKTLESDWTSLLRQFGFLSADCQKKGISLNVFMGCKLGFQRKEPTGDGMNVCISIMDEADYSDGERKAAEKLLKYEGVACVIGLLRSEANRVAHYEVDGSALHIVHYSAPSEIRIPELPAIQKLLKVLGMSTTEGDADGDDGGR